MQLYNQNDNEEKDNLKPKKNDDLFRGHRLSLTCLCIDQDGQHAYTGSKDGCIIKWSLNGIKIIDKIKSISKKYREILDPVEQKKHHTNYINTIAISTDNKFLASGGWDKHIIIWNPKDLSWIHTFSLHKQEVTALVFRQGNSLLYSGSADRSVMLWTLEDDDNRCFVESLYGHESPITSIDVLRRERVLTSGGRDQSIRIWKIIEQAQTVFETKHESVDIARFIDDQYFVSGGEDGTISVWTTMKRTPLVSINNAHKPEKTLQSGLSYWISALGTHSFKKVSQTKTSLKAVKKRKLGDQDDGDVDVDNHDGREKDVLIAKYGDDDDDDDDDEPNLDEQSEAENEKIMEEDVQQPDKNIIGLVASGSCDSNIRIWQVIKSGSKCQMKLHQTIECFGFVNDLVFTNNGEKLLAACGQEHKFGRWWKIKGTNNTLRSFDVNKV